MSELDLIIFDCDGVVVDSELLANTLAAKMKTKFGYPITAEEHMRRFVGKSESSPEYREVFSKIPEAEYRAIALPEREKLFRKELKAISGIENVLQNLKTKLCLASGGKMSKMDLTLGITGLKSYFEGKIFSAEMVPKGKPAPDVFLLAAEKMEVAPEKCLVIEDSTAGIQAARAASMKVFGFTGGSHMLPFMIERLENEKPDLIFENMERLPELIDTYR